MMKELTIIPNRRDAALYTNTLTAALEDAGIEFDSEIKEYYEAQHSDLIISVEDHDYDKAYDVMRSVIKKGPPR